MVFYFSAITMMHGPINIRFTRVICFNARHFGDTTDMTPVDSIDAVMKHIQCAFVTFIPKDDVSVTPVFFGNVEWMTYNVPSF